MIKLLAKIEQDYGLPVAISFAKQAIEQNRIFTQKLINSRAVDTKKASWFINQILTWRCTRENYEYWSNIHEALLGLDAELSYKDLKEYAAKDSNSKNLLQKLEEDHGKDVAKSFAKQLLMNKTTPLNKRLNDKFNSYRMYNAIANAFVWDRSIEGNKYWCNIANSYTDNIKKYELTLQMLEDYIKSVDPKTVKTIKVDTMQKILKEPQAMIAPFNKGNLNIKGIIHQAAKGIKDDRPFVIALIDEELDRIKTIIKNTPKDAFKYEGYDIRAHHLKNLILESKAVIDFDKEFKITPLLAIRFYEFEKLSKSPLDCTWIKSYLTQENMQKPSVSLFKSNKMSIKLENGRVSLVDFKTDRAYSTPVLYDKTKNEFYL